MLWTIAPGGTTESCTFVLATTTAYPDDYVAADTEYRHVVVGVDPADVLGYMIDTMARIVVL